jgi:hypothetical protein
VYGLKVSGTHGSKKLGLGQQYLQFEHGSLSSSCKKTGSYKPQLFMPHHSLQMRTFVDGHQPPKGAYKVVDTPTYLLARDEDCENAFHSTADFVSNLTECCSHY